MKLGTKKALPMKELIYIFPLNLSEKIKEKKRCNCRWKKKSKAIEENK